MIAVLQPEPLQAVAPELAELADEVADRGRRRGRHADLAAAARHGSSTAIR